MFSTLLSNAISPYKFRYKFIFLVILSLKMQLEIISLKRFKS